MRTQALLIEILLSGFFAIACFRARVQTSDIRGLAPRKLFKLIGRIERLRITRWQWSSMVLLLVIVRLQQGSPVIAEMTALMQFLLFLALPVQRQSEESAVSNRSL